MKIELKPCPFCGEIPIVVKDKRYPGNSNGIDAWHIECRNYECVIYGADGVYFRTRKAALIHWNRRTEP